MWSVFEPRVAQSGSDAPEAVDDQKLAITEALGIWSTQITNVREQTEAAVVELAGRFGWK